MKLAMWKRNLILLWFSQLIVMSGFSAMIPFIPLFIKKQYGITSDGEIAFYVAFFNFLGTLAYAVFCPIWGVLADRFGVTEDFIKKAVCYYVHGNVATELYF